MSRIFRETARSATIAEQVSMMCYLLSPEAGNMRGALRQASEDGNGRTRPDMTPPFPDG